VVACIDASNTLSVLLSIGNDTDDDTCSSSSLIFVIPQVSIIIAAAADDEDGGAVATLVTAPIVISSHGNGEDRDNDATFVLSVCMSLVCNVLCDSLDFEALSVSNDNEDDTGAAAVVGGAGRVGGMIETICSVIL
jgi:hypothetical protein